MADPDQVLEKAVRLLDTVVCAVIIEGARLVARHRDGSLQEIEVEWERPSRQSSGSSD